MYKVESCPALPVDFAAPTGTDPQRLAFIFSVESQVGALADCLTALKPFDVALARIESRPSSKNNQGHDIFVELASTNTTGQLEKIQEALQQMAGDVRQVGENPPLASPTADQVPWFPRSAADLDTINDRVVLLCEQLAPDHPGVKDAVYRKRRVEIAQLAQNYKHGQPLPHVDYTQIEIETWRAVYRKLTGLYPTHACREYRENFPLLQKYCGYHEDHIPQLADVSRFLEERTGFTIRPVTGMMTSRDFINSLAFRVFNATQYIRHHSSPCYSPEPDVCHELMGHVALLANPGFADFCQEIGLASLGASDEDIERLSSLFMYTVEFGLCREDGEVRVYGAGALACSSELERCLTDKAEKHPFIPEKTALQTYSITAHELIYFVAESIADVKTKFRQYITTLDRPFDVRYDPVTKSVAVVDSKRATTQHPFNSPPPMASMSA